MTALLACSHISTLTVLCAVLLAAWQDAEAVSDRVESQSRLFDLAASGEQQRLAAAVDGSSLPVAALAAAEHLQRVGHPRSQHWVRFCHKHSHLLVGCCRGICKLRDRPRALPAYNQLDAPHACTHVTAPPACRPLCSGWACARCSTRWQAQPRPSQLLHQRAAYHPASRRSLRRQRSNIESRQAGVGEVDNRSVS